METIYIVEDSDGGASAEYKPNFIIPGWKTSSVTTTSVITSVAAASLIPGFLFPSVVGLGLLKALGVGSGNKQDKKQTDNKDAEQGLSEIDEMIKRITLTKSEARRRQYRFPPGHPQAAVTYKLHPLATFDIDGKKDLYIPEENYATVLLEERESELLRLLVDLGAKRIEVRKKEQQKNEGQLAVNVSGEITGLSSVNTDVKHHSTAEEVNDNVRLFELKGKPWKQGDKIDRQLYSWLGYEASWQSLILAREVGGCTKATIEIKENTVYSSELEFQLGMKYKILSAETGLAYDKKHDKVSSYIVSVEFNEPA